MLAAIWSLKKCWHTLWMDPIYIVKTARRRQFCDFYRQSPKDHKLQIEKKIYICTSQGRQCSQYFSENNRQTDARIKWIRKENWLTQTHLNQKLSKKVPLECNLPDLQFDPSCQNRRFCQSYYVVQIEFLIWPLKGHWWKKASDCDSWDDQYWGWPKLYIPSTITTWLMFWHTKFSAIIMSYRPWTTASGQSCSNKIIKIFKNDFFWKTLLMRISQ